MTDEACGYLRRQFKTVWMLTDLHLTGLTTEEGLWRPAGMGLHVHRAADRKWRADWREHERYDLGPTSIAWATWHLGFWWSMVLDHSFGEAKLTRKSATNDRMLEYACREANYSLGFILQGGRARDAQSESVRH